MKMGGTRASGGPIMGMNISSPDTTAVTKMYSIPPSARATRPTSMTSANMTRARTVWARMKPPNERATPFLEQDATGRGSGSGPGG